MPRSRVSLALLLVGTFALASIHPPIGAAAQGAQPRTVRSAELVAADADLFVSVDLNGASAIERHLRTLFPAALQELEDAAAAPNPLGRYTADDRCAARTTA